jgi:acetylglutamate kinase
VIRDGAVVGELDADAAQRMLDDGSASNGMRAKLEAAMVAANAGVPRVRIGDMHAIADSNRGTFIRGAS